MANLFPGERTYMAENDPINDNHLRNISCALSLLDESLCQYERWANGDHAAGVLFREENALDENQRRTILDEIAVLRRIMEGIRDDMRLQVEVKDIAHSICVGMLTWWPTLVELESKYLRRYGVVPRQFAGYFDPKVREIIAHVAIISDVVKGGRKEST
jgi:hypothetical protein